MNFYAETLGCKVNQFETNAMISILTSRGHRQTMPGDTCDVCIINTCAVTGESGRKSRQAIRRLKKLMPGALIAVCGCYSQLEPEDAQALGADLIGGSGDKEKFTTELENLVSNRTNITDITLIPAITLRDEPAKRKLFEDLPADGGNGRTRAMLKIQDGCDNFCSYCIIPYARGRVRSMPVLKAAEKAKELAGKGFREIVITGIEISSYGKDLHGGEKLTDVIRAIAEAAPGVRLRLGSLDPGSVDSDFCEKLAGIETLCAHFHLSVQSGCDETLLRMGRKYDTLRVQNAIDLLRRIFPDCGITSDLIVGFPGETDLEFGKTIEFIRRAAFSDMHIFPFSSRPGTKAAGMPNQIDKSVKRQRATAAGAVAREASLAFRRGQIGKIVKVLFERERNGFWTGYCENYLEVSVKSTGVRNSVHSVQITGAENGLVWGEICRP